MAPHARIPFALGAGLLAASVGTPVRADTPDILVYGRGLAQIGIARSASEGTVGYRDFEDRPLSRVGELVETIPGMIATQHSGTGKANQYFLRGFNLDHGTDFAGFVDGVPINMRSHGHGQGYLDLNFLIPELVERIDYRKGPYVADTGDFAAAGTARFRTVDRLERPLVELTYGMYGYARGLAAGSVGAGGGSLLLALDGTASDGPWVLDEHLRKVNGAVKWTSGDGRFSLGATGYHARWTSTDQVPERAIASGRIDRFGFIDPDLGGRTTRIGVTGNAASGATTLNAYAIYYDFSLTSNFTYFLEDPVGGDEFRQQDRRGVFGGSLVHRMTRDVAGLPLDLSIGADARYDLIRPVGLLRTSAEQVTGTVRRDRVDEASGALFVEGQLHVTPRLRATVGLRGDYYGYDVRSDLAVNSGSGHDSILSPKVALAWSPIDRLELYANYGEGFHSNDVRGATISVDPATGDPADPVRVLVPARGGELGVRVERGRLTASANVYYLDLDSELVFVGDAGSTEPNAASHRVGTEVSLFWRPADWLTLDGSTAFTHARFRGVPAGEDRIPNAVNNVLAGGATAELGHGFSATVRVRHFGSAPLIEDDSARSDPTTLVNLGLYYRRGAARLSLDLFNLFDTRDTDISYFYASRLPGEQADGVADRHIHPVEPRQLRASLRFSL